MSNNINLTAGRAVNIALAHVPNNAFRFTNVGAMQALRDPSLRTLIDNTNPFLVSQQDGGRRVVAYKENSYNPRVLLNYKPASTQGYRTSRTAAGGNTGSNGVAAIQASSSTEILFNKHLEFEIVDGIFTSDVFKEAATNEYISKIVNPALMQDTMANPLYARQNNAFLQAGLEILSRANDDLINPLNSDVITMLLAGVGKNAAFPVWDGINGTDDAPIIETYAFESDGETPSVNFWDTILDTQRQNRFLGKPLLIGGQKMARFMQKKGIVSIADSGFDLNGLLNLPVLWYYDSQIDTTAGQDICLAFDNGAACLQTWQDHSDYGLVKKGVWNNMHYGNMTIDIAQTQVSGSQTGNTFSLDMDFRVKEGTSSVDLPTAQIVPSVRYGMFRRPTGFFTSNTSDILNKVTGIFAFKLKNKA